MKKLTSKKGFTLIEMLVVIAIIAVLVAIIVPTVTSSTTKAKAATDAANLRSVAAEVATLMVSKGENLTAEDMAAVGAPTCSSDSSKDIAVYRNPTTNEVTAQFGDYTISDFASAANNGTLSATGASTTGKLFTHSTTGWTKVTT